MSSMSAAAAAAASAQKRHRPFPSPVGFRSGPPYCTYMNTHVRMRPHMKEHNALADNHSSLDIASHRLVHRQFANIFNIRTTTTTTTTTTTAARLDDPPPPPKHQPTYTPTPYRTQLRDKCVVDETASVWFWRSPRLEWTTIIYHPNRRSFSTATSTLLYRIIKQTPNTPNKPLQLLSLSLALSYTISLYSLSLCLALTANDIHTISYSALHHR